MSHIDTNEIQHQNLPILKNFNAFNILEPEKVNLVKTDVSTSILVDVSDGSNKLDKSSELSPDLHGSFLDKVSDFDLLDLYQNIYVTPQQIKKEPCYDKNKNLCPDIEPFKVDFTELFEKAEKGKKLSEWTKDDENANSIKNAPQVNLANNPRSLKEILDNAIALKCSKLELEPQPLDIPELDPICEDDIDDFLQPKLFVDQSVFKETTQISSSAASHLKNDVLHEKSPNPNDKRQSLLTSLSKPIATYNTAVNDRPLNLSKISPHELETHKSLYCVNETAQVSNSIQECHSYENKIKNLSKIEHQSDVTPIYYLNEIKTSLIDSNRPSLKHITYQTESFPMLHTVKFDPKAYDKRRIVKNDAEKIGFTKGPNIYEKSIVLPQIMKRLAERKQVLDQKQSMQRKLILETGVTCTKMQNYNISRVSDRVTNTAQVSMNSEASNKHATYPTSERVLKDQESTILTEYQKPGGFSNVSKYQEPTKPTAHKKPSEYLKPDVPLKPPAYFLEPEFKPEVLMEDCSSKRVKALKARLAFEKFVYTGKLPP